VEAAQIRDADDWSKDAEAFFARAALENGLRFTQMEADRASWVLDELDRRVD
jgi:PadR family transcriptional regulator, regulatory protein AphA